MGSWPMGLLESTAGSHIHQQHAVCAQAVWESASHKAPCVLACQPGGRTCAPTRVGGGRMRTKNWIQRRCGMHARACPPHHHPRALPITACMHGRDTPWRIHRYTLLSTCVSAGAPGPAWASIRPNAEQQTCACAHTAPRACMCVRASPLSRRQPFHPIQSNPLFIARMHACAHRIMTCCCCLRRPARTPSTYPKPRRGWCPAGPWRPWALAIAPQQCGRTWKRWAPCLFRDTKCITIHLALLGVREQPRLRPCNDEPGDCRQVCR